MGTAAAATGEETTRKGRTKKTATAGATRRGRKYEGNGFTTASRAGTKSKETTTTRTRRTRTSRTRRTRTTRRTTTTKTTSTTSTTTAAAATGEETTRKGRT